MAGLTLEMRSHLDKKQAQIVTDEINCPVTPPAKVVYSITYALPGQVGFCIPQISEDPKYLQRLLGLLADEPLVISQQININNTTAGSIVITYNCGVMSDVEMRSHLCNLIQFAGNVEVLPATANQLKLYPVAKNLESRQDTKPKSSFDASVSKTKSNSVSSTHSQPVIQPTKQPAKVAYSVAHAIPGRVRFRIPRIASDPQYVQRLKALLKSDSTVTSERVNSAAVSIVITYKTGMMRDSHKRVQSFLSAAISHLASLIQSANDPVAAIS
ncbi:HMA2 domain-containing protein [Tolypothrix sp. VBCCA 56010]|uniref:HMA2 domain-containing protein n=1 Tax=Tolypothrix sp. VBCCA 56010 TaxID=3137731 RepID=UPI003D7ECEDE